MISFQQFKERSQAGKEKKIRSSGFIYRSQRRISVFLSWFLVRWFPGVYPNQVSVANVIMMVLVLILSAFVWIQPVAILVIQLLLLWFSSVMDKMDGELARHYDYFTQEGIYLDLLYHFLYPFVFYFSVGYYFWLNSGSHLVLLGASLLAISATLYKMIGKLRHHVRYKIRLEGHEDKIRDFRSKEASFAFSSLLWGKIIREGVMMIYGSVWVWYFILILASVIFPSLALAFYVIHLLISLVAIFDRLLRTFPRRSLFSSEEI